MRQTWIGTGWKMHKTLHEAEQYVNKLKSYINRLDTPELQVFIVPPFTVLHQICNILDTTNVLVGAQNMHWEPEGAFTGEISPLMIKDAGASLVELGHSERRTYFGETDFTVNKKVLSALEHDLKPLVCVGEPMVEKEIGTTREFILRQVRVALKDVQPHQMGKLILAYEPVWAIGDRGVPAEPTYANDVHQMIREILSQIYNHHIAESVPILYGGSVNRKNALAFIEQPQIDGLFIGRAAWKVEAFIELIELIKPGK